MVQNKTHIRGFNMYLDEKNQDVYYDVFTKTGYIIKEDKAKKFDMYKNRYILVFMGAILSVNFLFDLTWTIIASLILLIALEYSFRFKFLKSCPMIMNFKKGKKAQFETHENKGKEIVRIILYLLFAGLIIANAYVAQLDQWLVGLSYVAAVIAVYAAYRSLTYLRK